MENISVSGMVRKLRLKTSDIVGRYTEHLTNTITSAEAALDPKSLRSLGLGTIGLVRQHGIRITPDQLDDYIAHGNLNTAKDLQSLFKQYEVINPNVIIHPKSIIGFIPLNTKDKKAHIVVKTV